MSIIGFMSGLRKAFAWLPKKKRTNAWEVPANAIVSGRIITFEQLQSWGVPESEIRELDKAFIGKRHALRAVTIKGEDCYRVVRLRFYGERRIR